MDQTLNLKMLAYTEASGKALAAARKAAEACLGEEAAVVKQATDTAQGLISAKLINEQEKSAAESQLASHAGALNVVANLIDHIREVKHTYEEKLALYRQGQGDAGEKRASAGPRCFIDRRTGELSNADKALMRGLGLA